MSDTREPGKPAGKKSEEIKSLNADDLNVEELDDKLLEGAAGGLCSGFSCSNNWC